MSRSSRLTADVTLEAHNLLRDYCIKHERSKGFLLEKMIRKFCGEVEVATAAQVAVVKKKKVKKVLVAESGVTLNLNMEAWDKWVEFRKKAKYAKYKTDATQIKLSKMGSYAEQMLIVQNSIDMQYQGLFALKGNNSGHQSASKKESSHERIKRENSVKYGGQDESGLRVAGTVGHLGGTVDSGEGIRTIEQVDIEPFVDY